ncbi:TPA: hypothetical protein EYP37_07870 [Candidatus Poribacteria bacterium]|nr:hypothetical protein [Candidatus Poribacteria bacterium]
MDEGRGNREERPSSGVRPGWHRAVFISSLAIILILAIVIPTIILIRSRHAPGERRLEAEAGRAAAEEPIIWAQPTGRLINRMPTEVVFRVSSTKGIPVEVGREIPSSVVERCIRFNPDVPGRVVWLSQNNFAYQFQQPLMPNKRYDFQVKGIPVSEDKIVEVKPKSFYFSTPGFDVLSAYLLNWSGPELSAQVRWNLPIRWIGAEDLISVTGESGEPVRVTSLRRGGDMTSFILSFRNTGDKVYLIKIKRGFSSTVPGVKLEREVTLKLAVPKRELYISRVSSEESEAGYAINVICNVQGAAEVRLERKVERYVDLRPPVKVEVEYHPHGFRLIGPFLPEQTYELTIRAGLSAEGATLRRDFTTKVKIPAPSPRVQFAVRGRYLGRNLGLKLPLRLRSVSEISVGIWRLPPENILWASPNMWKHLIQYAEPVVRERRIPVEVTKGETKLIWLKLSDLIDTSEPGVYMIHASRVVPEEERRRRRYYEWGQTSDSAIVIITDMALIAKRSRDKVWVWAVDARSAEPRPRVQLNLYSQRNVLMGSGMTNGEGFCEISFEPIRDRRPSLITARQGQDFTYLAFSSSEISLEPFSVSGFKPGEANYRAYFYPERNLYRPGETIHFAVLLRRESTFRGISLPVMVSVRDPRGKHLTDLVQTTDETGLAAFQLSLPSTAPTGNYSFNVKVAEKPVAYGNIFLETFVPERMKVEVSTDKGEYRAGEPIWVRIQADYLFGAPAAKEGYRLHCVATEEEFRAKKFPRYRFGRLRGYRREPPRVEYSDRGTLDSKGHAETLCDIRDWSRFYNQINLRVSVEVEEAGSGRVSRSWTNVKVHPFPYYIGLKSDTTRFEPGKPVTVKGIILNPDGRIRKDVPLLRYQMYEVRYEYVRTWDPRRNRFSWEHSRRRYPTGDKGEVQVKDGRFELSVLPRTYWMDYLVEVRSPEGDSVSELMVRGWEWYDKERPEPPEILEIRLDRDVADYGDVVEAQALLPFEGRILWSVELDEVMRYEWQNASGEISKFSFIVPQGVTSVYVSALLIRTDQRYLVRRAFGVKRLSVRSTRHRLPLEVVVPDRIRPGRDLDVLIKGEGRYKATVAIVDEGILQITRFRSPDVYEGILRDQALGINTAETLGWIVNKGMMRKTGGGEAVPSMGMEMPSLIRLVSYWSGIVESDDKGELHLRFPLPQYLGRLRVMASVVDEIRMGSASKWVTVTTEVVVLATPPRFLYSGDRIRFPISLKNTTEAVQSVKLKVTADGQEIEGVQGQISLEPERSQVVWVPLEVKKLSGVLEITIDAEWRKDRFHDTLQIPVIPNRPYETDVRYLQLKSGVTDLLSEVRGWMPRYQKTRITLTPMPGLPLLNHVKYLIRYPYGCVEQTTSSLLPMIRMKTLLEVIDPELIERGELENKVRSGIARLISMQTPSGGFTFWPGGGDPAGWPSIYATFALLEAKEAGYPVPETSINMALDYIERYARSDPFGYFVLARGGRLQPSDLDEIMMMNRRKLYSEDELFLARALFLGGRPSSANEVLNEAIEEYRPKGRRSLRGDFYSTLRERAVRLYMRELIHPGSAENEPDASLLIDQLRRRSYYYSTQELAWSMLALGMRIQNAAYARNYTATLMVNGKVKKPIKTDRGLIWFLRSASQMKGLSLRLQSDGMLYAVVENTGFRLKATYRAVSENGISVQKRILDEIGRPVQSFRLGDIYLVEITVTNDRGNLYNVAIEDFLPAGFEVENPRLPGTVERRLSIKGEKFMPEYVDYRDERIQAFGTLRSGETSYIYVVRAVTQGKFMLPPVRVTVMYNPEIRAASSVGAIDVEGR